MPMPKIEAFFNSLYNLCIVSRLAAFIWARRPTALFFGLNTLCL